MSALHISGARMRMVRLVDEVIHRAFRECGQIKVIHRWTHAKTKRSHTLHLFVLFATVCARDASLRRLPGLQVSRVGSMTSQWVQRAYKRLEGKPPAMEWTPIAALNEDDGENKDGNILDGEGEDADMPSGDAESMVEDAADVPNAVEAALVDAEQLFFMPPSTPVFARTATFDAPLYTPSAGPSPSSSLAARYLNLSPPAPSTSARARSQSRAASPSRRPSLPDPFVDTRPGEAYLLNVETMRREKRRRVQSGDRPLYNVTEQAREAMVSLAYTRAEDARAWDLVPRVGTLERDLALANLDACRASLERAKLMAQCAEAEAQLEYARQSQLEYVKTRLMDERCGREAKAELIWMFEAVWPVQRDSNGRVF